MSKNDDQDGAKARAAATKIQANFRGYRVRKQLKESKESREEGDAMRGGNCWESLSVRQRQLEEADRFDRGDGRSTPSSINGKLQRQTAARDALEEKSATKIQAGVRGFLVRKRQQAARMAATRIQAGFRGFRARKFLKQNG